MRLWTKPPAWHRHAACVGYPPEIFFGFRNERPNKKDRREAVARAVCEGCPARPGCAEAGRDEPFGIWAGTTAEERGFDGAGHRIGATNAEARAA